MPHHYSVYGLNITSEIECPQLIAAPGASPDVTIRRGPAPQDLDPTQAHSRYYQVAGGQILLKIENVGRYLVSGGAEILVDAHPQAAEGLVRLFLLGSAFGALLHQRGYWPLHGSAIATPRGAAIFMGASGHGKSSLAGAFQRRGFPVLSDDVSAINFTPQGLAQVWPAYPRLHLWSDSLSKLGETPGLLEERISDLDKYELPLQHFAREALPVSVIYSLTVDEGEGLRLSPLKGFEKVQELTANTYRLHFLHGLHLEQQLFEQAQKLARQARMLRLTRPYQPFLLDELADLIQKDFSQ